MKVTFGAEKQIVLLKRKALMTKKKRLNLAGHEKNHWEDCMNLKAPFIHVIMSPPERLQ